MMNVLTLAEFKKAVVDGLKEHFPNDDVKEIEQYVKECEADIVYEYKTSKNISALIAELALEY